MQPDIITPSSAEAKAPNIPSEQPGKATEANDATSPELAASPPASSRAHSSLPATSTDDDDATTTTDSQNPKPVDTKDSSGSFNDSLLSMPAEDSDKIEPGWVEKADEIVDKTSTDPFYQDEAYHALSRAYLKKRFGLDVK